MPHRRPARATTIEAWLEARFPGYRYGGVLALLAVTYIFMASGPSDPWLRVVTVALQGLTLLAALLASRVGLRLFRIGALATVLALAGSIVSVFVSSSTEPTAAFLAMNVLLVGGAPVVIARALYRRGDVDIHTVLGSVCIYVLLALMFAFVYYAANQFETRPFFAQTAHPSAPDFLYFSFVTQATIGYGDLTAAGNLGRALASFEGLVGQLYLVTVVAVVVSRISTRAGRATPGPETQSPEAPG